MAKRTSIYLTEDTLTFLSGCSSTSSRLNSIVDRYQNIIKGAVPALTETQWAALLAAHRDVQMFPDGHHDDPADMMWIRVLSHPHATYGGKTINVRGLSDAIRDLSIVEQYAVADVVGRFWAAKHDFSRPLIDLLRECGANVLVL